MLRERERRRAGDAERAASRGRLLNFTLVLVLLVYTEVDGRVFVYRGGYGAVSAQFVALIRAAD